MGLLKDTCIAVRGLGFKVRTLACKFRVCSLFLTLPLPRKTRDWGFGVCGLEFGFYDSNHLLPMSTKTT